MTLAIRRFIISIKVILMKLNKAIYKITKLMEALLNKQGYTVINDFLPFEQALRLRRKILNQNHHRAWCLLTTPYRPMQSIRDNIDKPVIDKLRHKIALKADRRKKFAFSFYRSVNKHESSHQNKSITQAFTSQLLRETEGKLDISGEITDAFFASFVKQQFIGYHSDGSAGKYAFIYQLSKGWKKKIWWTISTVSKTHQVF